MHVYPKPSKPEIRFQPLPITNTKPPNHTINYDEPELEDADFFDTPRSTTPLVTPLNINNLQQCNTPVVFRGKNKTPKQTATPPARKVNKKRKLYDPGSFDQSNIPMF